MSFWLLWKKYDGLLIKHAKRITGGKTGEKKSLLYLGEKYHIGKNGGGGKNIKCLDNKHAY